MDFFRLLLVFSLLSMEAWTVVMAQSKALRSRQIGTEGQILARMFSEYDAASRPPVRGCYTSVYSSSSNSNNYLQILPSSNSSSSSSRLVNDIGFIICISSE